MAGKAELIDAVYRRLDGITRAQAKAIVEAIFAAIAERLAGGERVTLAGFGSFAVSERAARSGRNPATGDMIHIPAGRTIRFRGFKGLLDPPHELAVEAGPRRGFGGSLPHKGVEDDAPRPDEEMSVEPRPRTRFGFGDDPIEKAESGGGEEPPPSDPDDALPPPAGPIFLDRDRTYHVVEVAYATDRAATAAPKPADRYGRERGDGSLAYGICEVSIPEDHKIGKLEGPSWRRFEFRPDPEKHVVLLSVEEEDEAGFFAGLRQRVAAAAGRQVLVFLHGFNVSFEDAARRTAQIAYDLAFPGVPAFYSWPSQDKLSPAAYLRDASNAEWTVPHLRRFLEQLAERSGADAIHLIAHSMGNRALTRALEGIAAAMGEQDGPRFREVVLTAPDVDAGVFRQLAAGMRRAAGRVTLYASSKDRALQMSQKLNGFPRAGDAGEDLVVLPDVETVDASLVDTDLVGHFYYGDNRSVLSDVYYLLREGKPPGERFGLHERQVADGSYWVFRPGG